MISMIYSDDTVKLSPNPGKTGVDLKKRSDELVTIVQIRKRHQWLSHIDVVTLTFFKF